MPRRQPRIGTTVSSALLPPASAGTNWSLNSLASSPTVIACCWQIGFMPTNVSSCGCITGPLGAAPPSGFGRSSTMNGMPSVAAAARPRYIVQM
jgi:hypothetical protein